MSHSQSVQISLPPLTDAEAYHVHEAFSDLLRIVENYYGVQIHGHLHRRHDDDRPGRYRPPDDNEHPLDDDTIPF